MPLNGHSYLVSQGWQGSGTGLRQGAINRPLAIPQKRTLAGLGKDRDEAFPFWDHVFAAAAKSIQVKIDKDDDDSDTTETPAVVFQKTKTGLISNRRPIKGSPALSNSVSADAEVTEGPRLSLITMAKREAARRGLYARFYRGPVLGPDTIKSGESSTSATASPALSGASTPTLVDEEASIIEKCSKKERRERRKEEKRLSKEVRKQEKRLEKKILKKEEKRLAKEERRREKRRLKEVAEIDISDSAPSTPTLQNDPESSASPDQRHDLSDSKKRKTTGKEKSESEDHLRKKKKRRKSEDDTS